MDERLSAFSRLDVAQPDVGPGIVGGMAADLAEGEFGRVPDAQLIVVNQIRSIQPLGPRSVSVALEFLPKPRTGSSGRGIVHLSYCRFRGHADRVATEEQEVGHRSPAGLGG